MRPFCALLLTVLSLSGVMSEDSDYQEECLPILADRCFKNLTTSLSCTLKITNPTLCDGIPEFCSALEEDLDCAGDIIDTECNPEQGLLNFDSWLSGLRAVSYKICNERDYLLRDFTSIPCFNSDDFIECLEEKAKVSHVVDLLQVNLNTAECNRLLISLPTCNLRAQPAQSVCEIPQDIINELIYTFFSHSPCGQTRSHSFNNAKSHMSMDVVIVLVLSIVIGLQFVLIDY